MVEKSDFKYLSPAQICDLFEISKSTLFRWEKAGIISPPQRDELEQRQYTQKNIFEIAQQLKPQIKTKMARTSSIENIDDEDIEKAHESLYIWKFIQNQPNVLDELGYYSPTLSEESIQKLCKIGFERYEPLSKEFIQFAKIIIEKSEQFNEKKSNWLKRMGDKNAS
jgi:DNA-binding transcriptional MerR regulator